MATDSPVASRPEFRLSRSQRITLGWNYRTLSEVERIGGWGREFTAFMDLVSIAIVAVPVVGILTHRPSSATGAIVAVALLGLCICVLLLVARMNRCGIAVNEATVHVANPRGQVIVPRSEIENIYRGPSGVTYSLQLRNGERIRLWGIAWQTSLRIDLVPAEIDELRWRLGLRDDQSTI